MLNAFVFSPRGFFLRALLLILVLWVFNLLGYREYTCVICGTSPTGDPGDSTALLIGMCYALLNWATVMGAPILIGASGLFMIFLRYVARPEESLPPEEGLRGS